MKPKTYKRKSGIWHYLGFQQQTGTYFVAIEKHSSLTFGRCNKLFVPELVVSFKKRVQVYKVGMGKLYTPKNRFEQVGYFLHTASSKTTKSKSNRWFHARAKKTRVFKLIRKIARRNHKDLKDRIRYPKQVKHVDFIGNYLKLISFKHILKGIPKGKRILFINYYLGYGLRRLPLKDAQEIFLKMEKEDYEFDETSSLKDYLYSKYKLPFKLGLGTDNWYIEKSIQRRITPGINHHQYDKFIRAIQRILFLSKSDQLKPSLLPKHITLEMIYWSSKNLKSIDDLRKLKFKGSMNEVLDAA